MADLVNLTIDGHDVAVPKGTTILEAAKTVGTEVPHYCYHPGMSSPAMCRLCLVEVEGAPKPMPGCVTTVADGQVVRTQSEEAKKNRRGVLEFYLVNHPLDCPICDMSGECNLQDYVHAEGRDHGRGREPKRIFGRDDFGGDVLFYGDRCVMCTRCVRFMSEVEQDHRLTVVERGNRSVIDTFFEEGLDGTNWHGNIVDICPVGALVSKDFLHKARAWDLTHTPSVCTSCSQGCNIDIHHRDNLVQRLKPRENFDVNGWWMCDYGRHNYEWMNRSDRIEAPLVRDGGSSRAAGWKDALTALAARLESANGSVKAVASPYSSNEDLAALAQWVEALGGGSVVFRSPVADEELPLKGFPDLARRTDLAPNAAGARLNGMERVGDETASGGIDDVAEHSGVIIVLGDALADQSEGFGQKADLYVYLGAVESAAATHADFVFPVSTHAESEGTFTNYKGRVQRFHPALTAPGMARPAWLIVGALVAEKTGGEVPRSPADAFAASAVDAFRGISYDDIGTRGAVINEAVSLTGGD